MELLPHLQLPTNPSTSTLSYKLSRVQRPPWSSYYHLLVLLTLLLGSAVLLQGTSRHTADDPQHHSRQRTSVHTDQERTQCQWLRTPQRWNVIPSFYAIEFSEFGG